MPDEVNRIVLRCLEKKPSKRYRAAAELANDLRQLLPRRTVRPSVALRRFRPGQARLKTIALAGIGGLVAVAIYALMGSGSRTEQPASPPAVARPASPAASARATAPTADLGPSSRAALHPDASRPRPARRAALGRARHLPASRPAAIKRPQDKKSLDHVTMDPF
jgi:hypothetical protein